ncbi:MAG: anti-sigma factor domain-containing protein [Dongiaceae bacterium]
MKYENPELRDRLAAEYALGTLRGAARRRFQKLMAGDPALRDLTLQWELRLNDLAAIAKPVMPRPQLWQAIDRALGPVPRPQHERSGLLSRLWESLGFWRASTLGAAAVAAALVLYIAAGRPVAPETRYIAVLIDDQATPVLVASLEAVDGKLSIKSVKTTEVAANQDLELWLLPPQGAAPRSLGVLKGMQALVKLTEGDASDLTQGALAVSLEPSGGSATGAPTGPVLFSGAILPAADIREP